MEIKKEVNGTTLTVSLIGQLDLAASGNLKKELDDALKGTKEVIFDLSELTYVASAGLRVLFMTQKRMAKQGSMKLIHVRSEVLKILELTRFVDYFKIEQ